MKPLSQNLVAQAYDLCSMKVKVPELLITISYRYDNHLYGKMGIYNSLFVCVYKSYIPKFIDYYYTGMFIVR